MLKSVLSILVGLLLMSGGLSYAKTHKRTAKRARSSSSSRSRVRAKSSTKSSVKSSTASRTRSRRTRQTSASARTSKASPTTTHGRKRVTTARRSTQMAPTPERYREIQQALSDKGYFAGEPSGAWGADSVEALKRFQKEQNLAETGKLDSVSLIALGLGPKRNLSARSTTESRPKDDNRRPEGSERP